jgi:hypothetical protein
MREQHYSANGANNNQRELTMTEKVSIKPAGIDALGCMYNVMTMSYSDKEAIGTLVVEVEPTDTKEYTIETTDTTQYVYDISDNYHVMTVNARSEFIVYKTSISEVADTLSEKAGLEGGFGSFSASVTGSHEDRSVNEEEKYQAIVYDSQSRVKASFNLSEIGTNLILNDNFSKDLNSDDILPHEFLNKWGTHLISGVILGGETSFICQAELSKYTTVDTFKVDAMAKYKQLSKSATFDGETDKETDTFDKNIIAMGGIKVIGGSPSCQPPVDGSANNSDDYNAWLNTITLNPEFIRFASDGLIPVWELVSDNKERAEALEDAYKHFYDYQFRTTDKITLINGEDGSHYDTKELGNEKSLEPLATGKYAHSWEAPADNNTLVVVGFGARIDDNTHVTKILIKTLDLKTNGYSMHSQGGSNDPKDYEKWHEVPRGYVMTGIGLREEDTNLSNMVVYSQKLEYSTDAFLAQPRNTEWVGKTLSTYEVAHIPSEYDNKSVITGILVDCSNKAGGFTRLILQVRDLE